MTVYRCSSFRLVALLLAVVVIVALVTHHAISSLGAAGGIGKLGEHSPDGGAASSLCDSGGIDCDPMASNRRTALGLSDVDLDSLTPQELKKRVSELLRIRSSVLKELGGLEAKRREAKEQISSFHREIEALKTEATRRQAELERLRVSAEQARMAREDYIRRNTPEIRAPLSLRAVVTADRTPMELPKSASHCDMESCFDFSRCSLTSQFPVFLYDASAGDAGSLFGDYRFTENPAEACVFLSVLRRGSPSSSVQSLRHFNGDGRNHLILVLPGADADPSAIGRAMIATADYQAFAFRPGFDFVLPSVRSRGHVEEPWAETGPILPVRKRYLVSFQGRPSDGDDGDDLSDLERTVISSLQGIKSDVTDDDAFVDVKCSGDGDAFAKERWGLCGDEKSRGKVLEASTFALIVVAPSSPDAVSSDATQVRLEEAMRHGAIPVLLGGSKSTLPFSEVLDWDRAAVALPRARATELHFLLRSFSDADLFHMQRQGSLIWRNYLARNTLVTRTLLGALRDRLMIPPDAAEPSASPSVFGGDGMPPATDPPPLDPAEPSEQLGPLEQPKPSLSFRRNFSLVLQDSNPRWNDRFDPFTLSPHTPWDPLLPTDAKFLGSPGGFRPIGDGAGGSGHEFGQAIGGNAPSEQFTVVILTYEREQVLMDSLARLYGLPFLNRVIVVWNSETSPSPDLRWPDVGVPLEVVRAAKNSLNNRFLPFDSIETEAVLSIDDDMHLRHDEIVFGFRVWRENRDRLVGFPGRFHAWDTTGGGMAWNYNSNYSCELSMVLTGAAFLHRYYLDAYTNRMPQAIRDKVDEYLNCEDLAMNFLVSHLTGKPPVKVTSRWTFKCPDCPSTLFEDDSHFQERHKCINFFSRVYGYTPLMYTQFRADSVLFKTRIPADKQKCFKFL